MSIIKHLSNGYKWYSSFIKHLEDLFLWVIVPVLSLKNSDPIHSHW